MQLDEIQTTLPRPKIAEPEGTFQTCLLYTSDAADERSSVDLGGRRIIKKKTTEQQDTDRLNTNKHNKRSIHKNREEQNTN